MRAWTTPCRIINTPPYLPKLHPKKKQNKTLEKQRNVYSSNANLRKKHFVGSCCLFLPSIRWEPGADTLHGLVNYSGIHPIARRKLSNVPSLLFPAAVADGCIWSDHRGVILWLWLFFLFSFLCVPVMMCAELISLAVQAAREFSTEMMGNLGKMRNLHNKSKSYWIHFFPEFAICNVLSGFKTLKSFAWGVISSLQSDFFPI